MKGDNNYIIVNFRGDIILFSSPSIKDMLFNSKGTNIFRYISKKNKEDIIDIFSEVKDGDTKMWSMHKKFFSNNNDYNVDTFSPVYNQDREVESISISLTKQVESKTKIEFTNNKFEVLFNNVSDAIFVTDIEGNYLEVNDTAIERTGFTKEQFLKLNINDTPLSRKTNAFVNYFQEILLYGKSTANVDYIHKNGDEIETEISGRQFRFNGVEAILHISREVSERNKLHAFDIDTVLRGEEKERSVFASQINDIVGANLSLLKMYVDTFTQTQRDDVRNETAKKIKNVIDNSLEVMSDISNKISPHVLRNLGIKAALEVFFNKTIENSDLEFSYHLNIPDKIPESKTITLYRIIVEIINNITAHSQAKNARVKADSSEEWLFLEIKDNGVGFDIEEKIEQKSIGLLNVFTKTKSINGIIDYISVLGKGTVVKLKIPIDE